MKFVIISIAKFMSVVVLIMWRGLAVHKIFDWYRPFDLTIEWGAATGLVIIAGLLNGSAQHAHFILVFNYLDASKDRDEALFQVNLYRIVIDMLMPAVALAVAWLIKLSGV